MRTIDNKVKAGLSTPASACLRLAHCHPLLKDNSFSALPALLFNQQKDVYA